jgi:hypothetical protein
MQYSAFDVRQPEETLHSCRGSCAAQPKAFGHSVERGSQAARIKKHAKEARLRRVTLHNPPPPHLPPAGWGWRMDGHGAVGGRRGGGGARG